MDGTGIAGFEPEVAFGASFAWISVGSLATIGPFETPLAVRAEFFVDTLSVRLASSAAGSKLDPILDKMLRSMDTGGVEVAPEYTGTGVAVEAGVKLSPAVLSFRPPFAWDFVVPDVLARLMPARSAEDTDVSLGGYDTVESGELEKEPLRDPGINVDDRLILVDS